jgi:hypothetical protein
MTARARKEILPESKAGPVREDYNLAAIYETIV